jgi:hypothetical protein
MSNRFLFPNSIKLIAALRSLWDNIKVEEAKAYGQDDN